MSSMLMLAMWAMPARAATAYKRISLSTSAAVGNGASTEPASSGDGRYVAFTPPATGALTGGTDGLTDVSLRTRRRSGRGTFHECRDVSTQQMSMVADGTEPNGVSCGAVVRP